MADRAWPCGRCCRACDPPSGCLRGRIIPPVSSSLYITAAIPPLGGHIRERAEDFLVDEQPLYQPSGSGEHIYLFVEKRNMSTLRVARILAQHFGVHQRAVGFAGLKDKLAITRQTFSIHAPGQSLEDFPMLQHERMGVLWADHHTNKLRRGHLAGNRFSIKIRGVPITGALLAHRALMQLAQTGVPNRIGEQRFGYTRRNHLVGRAILAGDANAALDAILSPLEGDADERDTQREGRMLYMRGEYALALEKFFKESRTERRLLAALARGASPRQALRSIESEEEMFYLTAFQSAIFNSILDERLREGSFDRLLPGDIAFKHASRAAFDVTPEMLSGPEAADLEQRLAAMEISPSGPMWGARMKRASHSIDEREHAALASTGVTLEMLRAYDERRPNRIGGERRPLRIALTDPDVEGGVDEHGAYVRLAFDLPRGGFATAVLHEIMKSPEAVATHAGETDEDPAPQPDGK